MPAATITRYTIADAYALARSVGATVKEAIFLAAVMWPESRGDPNAVNPTSGAVGLWQIHPPPPDGKDPKRNAQYALAKLRTQGRGAWSANARPYMDRARAVANREVQTRRRGPRAPSGPSGPRNSPQLSPQQFLRALGRRVGDEYEWGGTRRVTGFDCSGLIQRVMINKGFASFPRTSGAIYAHSRKIDVATAIKTPGAILHFPGHIAVSNGDGTTTEARGEAYGVVVAEAGGRFTGGGLLPEINYGAGGKSGLPDRGSRPNVTASADPDVNPLGGGKLPPEFWAAATTTRKPPGSNRWVYTDTGGKVQAAADDNNFIEDIPGLGSIYNITAGLFQSGAAAVEGIKAVGMAALWLANPTNWRRAALMVTGSAVMAGGVVMIVLATVRDNTSEGAKSAIETLAIFKGGPTGAVISTLALRGSGKRVVRDEARRRYGERKERSVPPEKDKPTEDNYRAAGRNTTGMIEPPGGGFERRQLERELAGRSRKAMSAERRAATGPKSK